MTIRQITCWVATCDVCEASPGDEDLVIHFDDLDRARKAAAVSRWHVLSDGGLICPSGDDAHQAAMDQMLPPVTR
jgi:hypothetical protein